MGNWKELFPTENRYFETDNGILYNGDSKEILNNFPTESINSIITSPPYNVGIKYDIYNDMLSYEDYKDFLFYIIKEMKRVLKIDGRIGINHLLDASKPKRYSPANLIINLYDLVGLNYYTLILLNEKNPHRVKYTAWGSWLSASSPYIYNPLEVIIVGYKKQWKRIYKGESDMNKEEFLEGVNGIWWYNAQTNQYTKANFSLDIPYKWVKVITYKNDIVLDPFMGSGTTAVACEQTGRRWIGIEISKEYCEIAKKRILNII